MSFSDDIGVSGKVHIEVRDRDGRLVETTTVKNLVTAAGRRLLGRVLSGQTGLTGTLHMAVGSGKTATTPSHTQLDAQLDRVAVSSSELLDASDRVVLRVNATFDRLSPDAEQVLQEAGIVIVPPDGQPVLFNRVVFKPITRSSDLAISLSWDVLF